MIHPLLLPLLEPEADEHNIHVVPNFGPEHESSCICWCEPYVDPWEPGVIVHNVWH